MIDDSSTLPVPIGTNAEIAAARVSPVSTVAQLGEIPEEDIGLAKQKSARTRRAYRLDVMHFMRARHCQRRRIAPGRPSRGDRVGALYARGRARPQPRRSAGGSRRYHRSISTWCGTDTLQRTRSRRSSARRSTATKARRSPSRRRRRANCSTRWPRTRSPGCATGRSCRSPCRSGYGVPRSPRSASATCTRTAATTPYACNAKAEGRTRWRSIRRPRHVSSDGPLFRPLKHNGKRQEEQRRMDPDAIDRVVWKYAGALGLCGKVGRSGRPFVSYRLH
jgi:hypothetical protein